MKYILNLFNILIVKFYKGIGNVWIVKKLKGNESIEDIVFLLNNVIKGDLIIIDEFLWLKKDFEIKFEEKFKDCCDGFVVLGDFNFFKYRGNVKDSEKFIFFYYKGNIDLLSIENKNIFVIGLLNLEGSIEEREWKIVDDFVKKGVIILSGLVFGCDSILYL